MMVAKRCDGCRFFERDDEREGACNRYPPVPLYDGTEVEMYHAWVGIGHWCGEWKAKEQDDGRV